MFKKNITVFQLTGGAQDGGVPDVAPAPGSVHAVPLVADCLFARARKKVGKGDVRASVSAFKCLYQVRTCDEECRGLEVRTEEVATNKEGPVRPTKNLAAAAAAKGVLLGYFYRGRKRPRTYL